MYVLKRELSSWKNFLISPIHAAPFVSFRILFGLLMAISVIRFVYLGWIDDHYLEPLFHFHYYGFSWVKPYSPFFVYAAHGVLLLSSIGLMLGKWYRLSAILLFLSFTYTELLDLTYYLNHYYFVTLITFLLIFIPKPSSQFTLPRWCIWIFRFQLSLVYIYAGLAKINYDWLIQALPLKIWLPAQSSIPVLGNLLAHPFTPYVFSWFGMIYDCLIVFFLWWKPSRPLAYLAVIVFHVLTGLLFQIGVFPIVMIASTLIFFSNEWHIRFLKRVQQFPLFGKLISTETKEQINQIPKSIYTNAIVLFLSIYISFQALFPWRYLLYPGNLFWTEEGYRFSWRVMLMEKAGTAKFYVKDGVSGREGEVVNSDFLNGHQEKQMSMQPDMILQFAHFLGEYYKNNGVANPQVRAEVYVTLNARPSKLLINPQVNLMNIEDSFKPKSWIIHY